MRGLELSVQLFKTIRLGVGSLCLCPGRSKFGPQVVDFAQPGDHGSFRFNVRGRKSGVRLFDTVPLAVGSQHLGPGRSKLGPQVVDFG